jgi:wyosine [tRNA(Phe)-imidazoG37] synthetase (radical SAM superfamily)
MLTVEPPPIGKPVDKSLPARPVGTAFGAQRDFLGNRFVYAVVSPRARGLSIGVNLNPDQECNFDCIYCEVDRRDRCRAAKLDVDAMAGELSRTLAMVNSGALAQAPGFKGLPADLLKLRQVNLSGDGEPTLCPVFLDVVQAVSHVRARSGLPFFKIVLITNATGLDRPQVVEGLRCLTTRDEVWAKLDAGTQAYMDRINQPTTLLDKVLANILTLGKQRPVVIQSLFPLVRGQEPMEQEIREYAQRLKELSAAGAKISLVQIYSATRPTPRSECSHLPLRSLARIARTVREMTGLPVEVF